MAKCLRCRAGNEWIEGDVRPEPKHDEVAMWEILVPTVRPPTGLRQDGPLPHYFTTKYHQLWDAKVHKITGGLTIQQPVKGKWVAPNGEVFAERMIPVRIMATRAQIEQVITMTLKHYNQQAVLCFKLSSEVILRYA